MKGPYDHVNLDFIADINVQGRTRTLAVDKKLLLRRADQSTVDARQLELVQAQWCLTFRHK